MEIALTEQIQGVKDIVPSEARIKELAREEMGLASRAAWSTRSVMIAFGMFALSVSTFALTAFRGTG
jgi:hypothetical protein